MKTLLNYSIVVEPDRQRLSRLVLNAVESLKGNVFSATINLKSALESLSETRSRQDHHIDIQLVLQGREIFLSWNNQQLLIVRLPDAPAKETVQQLALQLRQKSEMADPELLRQQNARITADLEKAKARAAQELAQLESELESRRLELEHTQYIAETDALTELFNRGSYTTRLKEAIGRCHRQNEPLCLIMIDVDKFKEINDLHGHLYGDEYLKEVANAMRKSCRTNVDWCCRLGGDEFAIIVFSDLTHSNRIAKVILKTLQRNVSIGVAELLPDDTHTSLMERCDTVLYEAKKRGRGQVVSYDAKPPVTAHRVK